MKATIKIPTDLNEIPLKSYQKFISVVDKSNDDEFICHKMIEIFCGLRLRDVFEVRWKDVQDIAIHMTQLFKNKPEFQKSFTIQNIEFGFIPDLENMSFGEYIDLSNNINKMDTFHKAMAVLYRPIKFKKGDKYEIEKYEGSANYAEVMKFAPLGIVLGAKVFFWNLTNDLLKATSIYLEKMTKKQMTFHKENNLENNGDGINHYMPLLKETLQSLKKLPNYGYENALHTSLLKSKNEILKTVRCSDN